MVSRFHGTHRTHSFAIDFTVEIFVDWQHDQLSPIPQEQGISEAPFSSLGPCISRFPACGSGSCVVVGRAVENMSLSLYTFNIMLCPGDSKTILKTKETLSLLLASSFLHFCNLFFVHFSYFSYTILALSPYLECFLFPPPLFSPCPSTLCDLTQQ